GCWPPQRWAGQSPSVRPVAARMVAAAAAKRFAAFFNVIPLWLCCAAQDSAAQFCIHTAHIHPGRSISLPPGASRMSPEERISAVVSTVAAAKQEAKPNGERQHEENEDERF